MSLLLLLACARPPEPAPEAPAAPGPTLRERFGEWAFLTTVDAPSTLPLSTGGEAPTDAETCGACHPAFYEEWRATTHAAATRDLQFVAELAKPTSPRWLCLNCHAPTPAQRPYLLTLDTRLARADDLTEVLAAPNPGFDPTRVDEGVTCATCHVRRDADGQGVVVGPGLTTGAPHRVRVDPDGLRGVCTQCHGPGEVVISPQFFCWFETPAELAAGPEAARGCVDCHMPPAERPVAATGAPVATRQHHWVGGGVPKRVEGYDTLLARGWEPGLAVEVSAPAGQPGAVEVRLVNHAGHALPTADPERHLRVEARLESADGRVLETRLLRVGQRWDWGDAGAGRPARRVADERLPPGGERRWSPGFTRAGDAVVVEVAHVRLDPDHVPHMTTVVPDAELAALWPEAGALLPVMDQHYPLATYVFRERVSLADGARARATPEELVAASRALAALPLADKRARLDVP